MSEKGLRVEIKEVTLKTGGLFPKFYLPEEEVNVLANALFKYRYNDDLALMERVGVNENLLLALGFGVLAVAMLFMVVTS